MNKAGPVFGLAAMGFGTLLIWSALTKQPLFGPGGLIRTFVSTGKFDGGAGDLAEAGGKAATKGAQDLVKKYFGASTPPNSPPPGSAGYLDA
jgi:hypothetical protein